MRGKSNFYKHLVRIFWLSLIVGTVGIWYYVDRSIPDRVSVTEHAQEEFTFSLPGGLLYTVKAKKWHWEIRAISRPSRSP